MKKNFAILSSLLSCATLVLVVTFIAKGDIGFQMMRASAVDKTYTIDAFQQYSASPSTEVEMKTTNGNSVYLSCSATSYVNSKILIEPNGFIGVLRNDALTHKNAISGLINIGTDAQCRIEYSYADGGYVVDDAINGNYSFPDNARPSFFKIYNNTDSNIELSSLTLNYSCSETINSIISGAGAFTNNDGEIKTTSGGTTFSFPFDMRKGIIKYSLKDLSGSSDQGFAGPLAALHYDNPIFWVNTDTNNVSYVWNVVSNKGYSEFGTVNAESSFKWQDKFGRPDRSFVHDFVSNEYVDYEFHFDVDNNYYAVYQGNQIVSVRHTDASDGSKIGFRFNQANQYIKDIKVINNCEFKEEKDQMRSWFKWYVHKEQTTVYETDIENAMMFLDYELPETGTITFDYLSNGKPNFNAEGIIFSESKTLTANSWVNTNTKYVVFGTCGSISNRITMVSGYKDLSSGNYSAGWMTTRNGLVYTDNTLIHIKLVYNFPQKSFAMSYRYDESSAWTLHTTFKESDANKDITGLKYLGFRSTSGHPNSTFNLKISNLVVNGEAW